MAGSHSSGDIWCRVSGHSVRWLDGSWPPAARALSFTSRRSLLAIVLWIGAIRLGGCSSDRPAQPPPSARGLWKPIAAARSARVGHTTVWTGTAVIVWGGSCFDSMSLIGPCATGERYDPQADRWSPMSTAGAPGARFGHTAVWTGSEMLLAGGNCGQEVCADSAYAYSPGRDEWRQLPRDTRMARYGHGAIWSGTEMVVWGGSDQTSLHLIGSGLAYSPGKDAWRPLAVAGEPSARHLHAAVWTGSTMVIWGGEGPDLRTLSDGARYEPSIDAWTAIASPSWLGVSHEASAVALDGSAFLWQGGHAAIWSEGTQAWTRPSEDHGLGLVSSVQLVRGPGSILVWASGGVKGPQCDFETGCNAGAVYDGVNDRWSPMSLQGAPAPRAAASAVGLDASMFVHGGESARIDLRDDGALFTP